MKFGRIEMNVSHWPLLKGSVGCCRMIEVDGTVIRALNVGTIMFSLYVYSERKVENVVGI